MDMYRCKTREHVVTLTARHTVYAFNESMK